MLECESYIEVDFRIRVSFQWRLFFGFLIVSYDTVNQHLQRATFTAVWISLLTPHLNWRFILDWNCLIGILMWVLELGKRLVMLFRFLNRLSMIYNGDHFGALFFFPSSFTASWFSPFNTMFLWIIIRILILLLLFGYLIIFFLSTHDINFLWNKLLKQQHL